MAASPSSSTKLVAAAAAPAAPRASILGRGLSKEQRVCLLGLVALSLPPEDQALGRWNLLVLQTVAGLLRLEDGHWMALQPLLYSEGNDPEIRQVQLEAFRKPFFPEEEGPEEEEKEDKSQETAAAVVAAATAATAATAAAALGVSDSADHGHAEETERCQALRRTVLRDLLVLLACDALYDARSRRVLMALAADAFDLDWREVARVEAFSAFLLHEKWAATHQKDKVNKALRYAKIGAAALGGGALLALTGGLAAPAISVGLAAMGTTAGAMVASVTTTASVATLFGASGAGLVGYKMKRRTEGIKQFELRHVAAPLSAAPSLLAEAKRAGAARRRRRLQLGGGGDGDEGGVAGASKGGGGGSGGGGNADADTGRMAVCILIAGWLQTDESEFDTPFGVEPGGADVGARLRLFYQRHNRDNVRFSSVLARDYEGREEELEAECRRKYGASPFDPLTPPDGPASTPALLAAIPEEEKQAVLRLIEERTGTAPGGDASPPKTGAAARRLASGGGGGGGGSTSEADDAALAAEVQRIVGLSSPAPSFVGPSSSGVCAEGTEGGALQGGIQESSSPDKAGDEEAEVEELEERYGGSTDVAGTAEAAEGDQEEDEEGQDGEGEGEEGLEPEEEGLEPEEELPKRPQRSASETEALLALVEEAAELPAPWWLETFPYLESFTLHWESAALKDLGSSVMEVVASLGQQAALEVLTFTAAASLVSALAWPITLLQAADMIDSTWHLACEKADRAGQLLARVLMKKEHGHRPVVLVGFSMGARVIYACLQELARAHRKWEEEQQRRQPQPGQPRPLQHLQSPLQQLQHQSPEAAMLGSPAAGLVHTAVLLGTPVSCAEGPWRRARAMVADRLVNCYSRKDWVLSLMYRYQKFALSAAGIAPVRVPGVEDVDVSDVIKGHQHYSSRIRDCLLKVGLDDCFAPEARRRTDTRASTAVPGATVADGADGDAAAASGHQVTGQGQGAGRGAAAAGGRDGHGGSMDGPPVRKDSDVDVEPTTILY